MYQDSSHLAESNSFMYFTHEKLNRVTLPMQKKSPKRIKPIDKAYDLINGFPIDVYTQPLVLC